MARRILRQLFTPLFLALTFGAWAFRDSLIAAWGLKVDFATQLLLWALLAVWVAERLFPGRPEWRRSLGTPEGLRAFGRDLLYVFVIAQLSALLVGWAGHRLSEAVTPLGLPRLWPELAPPPVRAALAFVLAEGMSYGYHRAAHRFAWLWRFHSTHHVVTELTGAKALRTHPVDNLLFHVCRVTPLILLGAGAEDVAAAGMAAGLLGLLAHANLDLETRGWGLLLNLPAVHAVHHSADEAESRSNFGCHTVLFDRLFGTFRAGPREPLTLGVEPVGPRTLVQELLAPVPVSAARARSP